MGWISLGTQSGPALGSVLRVLADGWAAILDLSWFGLPVEPAGF